MNWFKKEEKRKPDYEKELHERILKCREKAYIISERDYKDKVADDLLMELSFLVGFTERL